MRSMSFLIALPLFASAVPVVAQDIAFVSGTGEDAAATAFGESAGGDDFADERQSGVDEMAERICSSITTDQRSR